MVEMNHREVLFVVERFKDIISSASLDIGLSTINMMGTVLN